MDLIDWLVGSRGEVDRKHGKRRIRATKVAYERGGITKVEGALISSPAAPRGHRTLASTENPQRLQLARREWNYVLELQ